MRRRGIRSPHGTDTHAFSGASVGAGTYTSAARNMDGHGDRHNYWKSDRQRDGNP
jgi:hypothetical protein